MWFLTDKHMWHDSCSGLRLELLEELIKDDRANVTNESDLLDLIGEWAEENGASDDHVMKIIKGIRYIMLNNEWLQLLPFFS